MTRTGFRTDTGRVRSNNEDALLVLPKFQIYVVADGVGGHQAGEIASRKAVNGVEDYVAVHPIDDARSAPRRDVALMEYFLHCLRTINKDIFTLALERSENAGMATTVVLAHVFEDKLYVVNVGDSRAYIIRNGDISQITIDHSVVGAMVSAGRITKEEARVHPQSNEITRALGVDRDVAPDFFITDLSAGDRILLCTDGLHGELTDAEILAAAAEGGDMNETCRALVELANHKGGRDNITVICVMIE